MVAFKITRLFEFASALQNRIFVKNLKIRIFTKNNLNIHIFPKKKKPLSLLQEVIRVLLSLHLRKNARFVSYKCGKNKKDV